jgi:hypothetical protein
MIYVGDVKEVSEKDIILTNAAWIPETSRWNEFVKGEAPIEMEPYAEDVLVKQDPILDATRVKDRMKIEVK